MKKTRFTLVELLAVIAIIGVLAGILIPVVSGVQLRGKITQAKSDMKTIETAIEAFAADNGGRYIIDTTNYKWADSSANNSRNAKKNGYAKYEQGRSSGIILELSDPENVTCSNNQRKIRYLDPSKGYTGNGTSATTDQLWPDPWGNPYNIWICLDGSGRLTPHTGHNVYNNVILWSNGPDGSSTGGTNAETDPCGDGDDVASWHK